MFDNDIEYALHEKVEMIREAFKSIGLNVELTHNVDTYYLTYSAKWNNELWEEHFGNFSNFALRQAVKYFPTATKEPDADSVADDSSLMVTIRIGNLFDLLAREYEVKT